MRTRAERIALPILGLLGMTISAYLAYVHLFNIKPICLPGTDCETVLASPYARFLGIPLGFWGLAMYALLTGLGLLLLRGGSRDKGLIILGIFGTALGGFLYSLYLIYLEIFTIHAFCMWCLFSAIVITIIFVLSLRMLRKS